MKKHGSEPYAGDKCQEVGSAQPERLGETADWKNTHKTVLSFPELMGRVTPEWMDRARTNPNWQPVKSALAEQMVKHHRTPWRAAGAILDQDPKHRTQRQLHRMACQVEDCIRWEFGQEAGEDPIGELVERFEQNGEVWVPLCHARSMHTALVERGCEFLREKRGVIFTRGES
jgi:hypothetical protein